MKLLTACLLVVLSTYNVIAQRSVTTTEITIEYRIEWNFGNPTPNNYGGLIGAGSSRIDNSKTRLTMARLLAIAEKERQDARYRKEQDERFAIILYNNRKADEKSEVVQRVMNFRLEQATNGSKTYQLMVSTNYLKGTDGFPVNTNLSTYWCNKALTIQ